jgi:hypothetical protein
VRFSLSAHSFQFMVVVYQLTVDGVENTNIRTIFVCYPKIPYTLMVFEFIGTSSHTNQLTHTGRYGTRTETATTVTIT